MAAGNKDIKMLGLLVLGLLVLMILIGTTYVVGAKFKESLCTTDDSDNVFEGGSCLNATGGSAVTVDAITQSELVEDAISVVLGFLGIVVIVSIAKIILRLAKGMGGQ